MIRTGIFTGRQSPPHFRVSLDKDDATRTVACKSIETLVETFCEYITRAIRNTWRGGKWQNTFASCCSFYSISERNSTLKWVPCWMEQKRGKVRKKGREKRSIHYLKSRSFRRNVRKMQRAFEGKSVSRGWNVKGSVTYIIMPRECDFRVHSRRTIDQYSKEKQRPRVLRNELGTDKGARVGPGSAGQFYLCIRILAFSVKLRPQDLPSPSSLSRNHRRKFYDRYAQV